MAYSNQLRDEIKQLFLSGVSLRELGRRFKINDSTIRLWANNEGWFYQKCDPAKANKDELFRMLSVLTKDKKLDGGAKAHAIHKLTSSIDKLERSEGRAIKKTAQSGRAKKYHMRSSKELREKALSDEYGLYSYQKDFIIDKSRFRAVKKSRQIGFSYAIALDALLTAAETGENAYLTSASQDQADTLIDKAVKHAEKLDIDVIAANKSKLILPNGAIICAKAANYRTIQGFSGHIYFDEFAWIYNSKRVFEVAAPIAALGDRRITAISTPFEKGNQFYQLMDGMDGKFSKFSKHAVTIDDAIKAGCPINIDDLLDLYDKEMFDCFFRCKYFESGNSLIDYDIILKAQGDCLDFSVAGELYGGFDVGRKRDASEIYLVEQLDKVYVRRHEEMLKKPFAEQKEITKSLIKEYNLRKFRIDESGIGANIAEDLHKEFPKIVTGVTFTPANKEKLALNLKELFDKGQIMIPCDQNLVAQIHSIKRIASGKSFKYDATRNDEIGHADKFWALALACLDLGLDTKRVLKVRVFGGGR